MTGVPIVYGLLPALYRNRDAASDGALLALTQVLDEARAIVEQDIDGLYVNWFAETADEWVLPYIGELVGLSEFELPAARLRAMVADTIAFRRRKGSLPATEKRLADLTGWPVQIRDGARGRTIAVHAWRHPVFSVALGTPAPAEGQRDGGYHFSPLGVDIPLYNPPRPYPGIEAPFVYALDAPHRLQSSPPDGLLPVTIYADLVGDGVARAVPSSAIVAGDLSHWRHEAGGHAKVVIDPELGRLLLTPPPEHPPRLAVGYTYAATAAIGGGPYERVMTVPSDTTWVAYVDGAATEAAATGQPRAFPTLAAALAVYAAVPGCGMIRLLDSATHDVDGVRIGAEPDGCAADPNAPRRLTIEALSGENPCLTGDITADGRGAGSELVLSGLWIAGKITVCGLTALEMRHCTLRQPAGRAAEGGVAIEARNTDAGAPRVTLESCLAGPVDLARDVHISTTECVIDCDRSGRAIIGHGQAELAMTTVLGTTTLARLVATDVIFDDRLEVAANDEGTVRNSYFPDGSRTPPPADCVTGTASLQPLYVSRTFGQPGYAALAPETDAAITAGGTAQGEMGVYHALRTAEREALLEAGLKAYLPFGLSWHIVLE